MMNCVECPWFESCDELDESYCINDELNRVKTELKELDKEIDKLCDKEQDNEDR